jgi:UDP-2,3-diacylglucosamine hydrolase
VQGAFIDFTRHWQGKADTLLINGDLFDFWCEYRTVVPADHFHTLRALADLRESGVRLILVGGNHDSWGGRFLEETVGLELADGPIELDLAGRRALIAHGDGLGPGDLGYKILRRTLRSPPASFAMRWVHPDIAARIVGRVSRTGKREGGSFGKARARADILEEYAAKLLEERDDLDLVVFGHCHTPVLKAVGTSGHYVNSGDWVEHRTVTIIAEQGIEQVEWGRDSVTGNR